MSPQVLDCDISQTFFSSSFIEIIDIELCKFKVSASLVAQMVKNSLAMQETWVRSLSWGDPLGEDMATHSSILAWRIPWTEEPRRLQFMGSQGSDMA